MHKLATNVALLLLVSIFCLVILEILVRLFMPQSSAETRAEDKVGWMHRPNTKIKTITEEFSNMHSTNSHSFIDEEEYSYDNTDDDFRILFLGDSFTEAKQVPFEKAFHQLLEGRIKSYSSHNIQAINTGHAGYGTDNEYLLLKHYGLKYQPDIVIMMFLDLTDVSNNYFEHDTNQIVFALDDSGQLYIEKNNVKHNNIKQFILRNSELVRLLYFQIMVKAKNQLLGEQAQDTYTLGYEVFHKEYSEDWVKAFALTKQLIRQSRQLAEDNGSTFILVSLTIPVQVDEEKYNEMATKYPEFNSNNIDLEKPKKILVELCEQEHMNCLHLLDPLREYSKTTGEKIHYEVDDHWNEKGHELAADEIYQYLLNNNFLPDPDSE